jgi:DHA1 family tetracycline resistance protein-like MFS transporter
MRKGSLAFIFFTVLIDVLGFGLILPVLPTFIGILSHQGPVGAARDFGFLLGLYGAMQFLFAPMLGNLSDRFGRRPVLLFALLFSGIDYVIMACAPSLPWLYVGRVLSGIAGSSFTAANGYIADVSPPEKRSVNFGVTGAAFGVGFIVGPALGGLLGQIDTRLPFWVAAALALLNLCYGFFVLPESLKRENRRAFSWKASNPIRALSALTKYPVVWAMTPALVATYFADKFVQSTWILFMKYRFNWNVIEMGISVAAIGLLCLIFQTGIGRWIIPKWGERKVILVGIASGIFEIVAITFAPRDWMVYVIMVLAGMNFLSAQCTQGVLSRQVRDDEQGALQGALTSLNSLTGTVGPPFATFLFAFTTRPDRHHPFPGSPFLAAAVLYLIALIIAAKVLKGVPEAHVAEPSTVFAENSL